MISAKTTKRETDKFIRNAARMLPMLSALAFVRRRQRARMMPLLLSAIGAAAFGSIAAILIFSPRSRDRAFGAAKDVYGRVAEQLDAMGISDRLGLHDTRSHRITDGLVSSEGVDAGPTGF